MKNTFIKIIWVLIFSLFTSSAVADQCAPTPLGQLFEKSDLVFDAEVVTRQPVEGHDPEWCWKRSSPHYLECGPKIANLKIKEIWKGRLDGKPTIYSGDGCLCLGSYLTKGETYIIFAQRAEPKKPYRLIATPGCGSIRLEKYFIEEKRQIKKLADSLSK